MNERSSLNPSLRGANCDEAIHFKHNISGLPRRLCLLAMTLCAMLSATPAFAQTIDTCDGTIEGAINLNTYTGYEPPGLIGHWSLDESVAGPFIDSSATGNNGAYADATFPPNSGTQSIAVTGITGMAFYNDNSDRAHVKIPSHASYTSLTAFTLSMWVNLDSLSGSGGLFSFQNFINGIRPNNTNQITLQAPGWSGTAGIWRYGGAGVFSTNKWTHLAIAYDYNEAPGTVPKLYVNGVLNSSTFNVTNPTGSFTPPATANLLIGIQVGSQWWYNTFDEVRLYNRVLSQAEIQGLYKQRLEYCDGTSWIHMVDKPCPSGIASCGGNPNERLVFVRSTQTAPASFGSITGADALCQGSADAAGLHGTYMAWLGDDTTDPATRFEKPTVPYVRVDGVKIADNWTDLVDGDIDNLLNKTQIGTTSGSLVASNVHPVGGGVLNPAVTAHCNNYTSGAGGAVQNTGRPDFTNGAWSNFQNRDCGIPRQIYCFEQQTAPISCTNRGEFYYNTGSDVMQWCDSAYVRDMGPPASGSGGCTSPSGSEGAIAYDTDRYKFCDGNGWVDIGK